MSKLSQPLKALINSPHARPDTIPAPPQIKSLYEKIARDASSKDIALSTWLSLTTAATMTMNSPESLLQLHGIVSRLNASESVYAAELMREVGVKCIGFNGIPRSINCLNAFYAGLPSDVRKKLSTVPTRSLTPDNVSGALERGNGLWKSIYAPLDEKLRNKLAQSHPDLAVHIIECGYGSLFSDNPSTPKPAQVGRVLTSIVAVSCLRAQTGTGPQVVSHVFGLRKAFQDQNAQLEKDEYIKGAQWLATDEGSIWMLEIVDSIVQVIGEGKGTTFAPGLGRESKL
ncbi:conserved mitochondrial protein [Penicillium riverlandense]|uniref:conserved mitochondrial protein n=1 Tax=Penicillium riverlandense TaxID=1903569 RepID=UPI002549A764|nr:conserved mitochondrial protein [Penicillium riverlandense]KAJ5811872.1 conserved mitochondrial protein [Penicillium riverlandense]